MGNIYPFRVEDLKNHFRISDSTAKRINDKRILSETRENQIELITNHVVQSKFGQATTHMDKLLLRLDRGLGNPAPLILIGIGSNRLIDE